MAVLWLKGNCPDIPEISKQRLDYLYTRIKPVMRDEQGVLHHVHPEDLINQSYIWNPAWGQPVGDLNEYAKIETYHSCGYIAMFKPSVEEVIAQIPEHMLSMVDFFEIIGEVGCFSGGDGHRTTVLLYTRTDSGSEQWFERMESKMQDMPK